MASFGETINMKRFLYNLWDKINTRTGLIVIIALFVLTMILINTASAHHTTINNNITEVTEITEVYDYSTTLIEGISEDDLHAGLSVTAASGGHQFDFSTTDWQGSIVGAWYEEQDAVSFGVGKRFDESFMPNTLLHGSYTQNGSDDLWVFGGTFRF